MKKFLIFMLFTCVVILAMAPRALAQVKVGPSNYPHTTDGEWTDWYPGTEDPYEWHDIGFFKGLYSYYSADYIPADGDHMYVMNDFFSNTEGLDSTQFNLFRMWVPGQDQTDYIEVHIYDGYVEATKNGEPLLGVSGAYSFAKSPFYPDTDHTVYELEVPITLATINRPVAMTVSDPHKGSDPPEQWGGAFVGTVTPLEGGGTEVQQVVVPVSFSVDGGYYNALRDGVSGPAANPAEGMHPDHTSPDDVYSLGPAGGHNLATEGEIFQSSGDSFGAVPDGTNADRISGALGVGVGPHAPPPAAAPTPTAPGALGLQPNDNMNGLSYGKDGGDILHFSVDPDAVGQVGTDVRFQAVDSPTPGMLPGALPNNGGGGDPGNEAAGDIFVSQKFTRFGKYLRVMPAVALSKLNSLELDEVSLGLQAPASTGSVIGAPEDDLDALEMSNTGDELWGIDIDVDGLVDADSSRNAFFSLDLWSPTITGSGGTINACDILVTRDGTRTFSIYADGVDDIDLLAEDNMDALILSDITAAEILFPDGYLDMGLDVALFSLSSESPTLWGTDGAPGIAGVDDDGINGVDDLGEVGLGDDFSPADVFYTDFLRSFNPLLDWQAGGSLYATAEELGLLAKDNLNALDISVVPEPTTIFLLGLGGLALMRRRKK